MYDLINQLAQTVVGPRSPDHVTEYEWLLENIAAGSVEGETPESQLSKDCSGAFAHIPASESHEM
jgi:hypothetical protein